MSNTSLPRKGYDNLEIYKLSFDLAISIHKMSLNLPKYELYEQGSQVRRSSQSIKNNIVEGYGRRRYKADFIKFLIYAQASCDETISQLKIVNPVMVAKKLYNLSLKVRYLPVICFGRFI